MEKMNTDLGKYNKEQFVKGLANVKTNKFVICFGSTKAGKSSFINKIDKKKEATVSNDDKSSTFHAMDYSIVHPIEGNYLCKQLFGSDVVILDSRGFSDSGGSEDSATTCRLF
jgi:predicted GTPase